jgi:hypothetical protein
MNYTKRIYQILYPNHALVASQLPAEDFARHYQLRSAPNATEKMVFAEIDTKFRNDYFKIDEALDGLVPHADGSRKRTKFIASYRVLEHMDLDCIKRLIIANPDGSVLKMTPAEYTKTPREGAIRIVAEICPLSMLIMTKLTATEFGKRITHPEYSKGAPKVFFTMLDVDLPAFVDQFEKNPLIQAPIRSLHPSVLRDAYQTLDRYKRKTTRGLCLHSSLDDISWKLIRHGFWFVSAEKTLFFPIPSLKEIEKDNYKFWKGI